MCVRARVLNPKGREYISNEQNEMGHFDPSNGGICVRKRGVFFLPSFAGCRNEKYHETFINVSISRDPFAIIDYKKGEEGGRDNRFRRGGGEGEGRRGSLNRDFMAVTRLIFGDKIPAHVLAPPSPLRVFQQKTRAVNRGGHFF